MIGVDKLLMMGVPGFELIPCAFRFIVGWIAAESLCYCSRFPFSWLGHKNAFDEEYNNVISLMRHVMHCLSEEDKVRLNEVIEELSVASFHLAVEQLKDPGTWKGSDSTVYKVSHKAVDQLFERFDEVVSNCVLTYPQVLPFLTRAVPLMDNLRLSFCSQEEKWDYLVDAAKSRYKALSSVAIEHAKNHLLDPDMCDKVVNNLCDFPKDLTSQSGELLKCDFVFF